MQQLIYFFQRYKTFLFFLFLEIIAVALIINNNSFHKSKVISSSNFVTGGIYEKASEFTEYLNLKNSNKLLSEENTLLKNKLELLYAVIDTVKTAIHPSEYNQRFLFINGKTTNNSYSKANNFITINRGSKQGVTNEMAVTNSKGIIGITDNVSPNFSRVQSILNSKSRINAGFKNNNYYGTLKWDGADYNTVQLTDIPRQAIFKIGDTVITGGKSTIFPKGIPVGFVSQIPKKLSASNTINVTLFNDMSNIGHVYVITNLNKNEIKKVENKNE